MAVAKQEGLDEGQARQVFDTPESLDAPHRAAVALADALMTQPSQLAEADLMALREYFSDDQLVELTLDVMKWNYQKVMVAMGTDTEFRPGELADLSFDENGHFLILD